MKKRAACLRFLLAVAAVLVYFTALLCVILPAMCKDGEHLARDFAAYGDRAVTGLTAEGERTVADALARYFSGDAASPQTTVARFDALVPAFSEKELSHLKDIRGLIDAAQPVTALCFAALLLMLVCVFVQGKGEHVRTLGRAFCVLPALLAALAVWAAFNFDGLFITFHKILFTNDDWLLDPRTHLLIQLMPLEFFMAALKRAALHLLLLLLLPYIALRVISRRMNCGRT